MTEHVLTPTALWQRYADGDRAAQELLARENLGLVHHVARKLAARLHDDVELDELVSAGAMGLLQAMASFDATRGLSFSTFAVPRIRGAILDELRRTDHVPRSVRRKMRDLAAARESLAGVLGRSPTDAETGEQLGVPEQAVRRWELDIEGGVHVPLDRHGLDDGVQYPPREYAIVDDSPGVDEMLSRDQEALQIKGAMALLKPQERTVLALHYFEELKLQEIAEILGLSACRISQIRTAALGRLRAALAPLRAA